METERLILRRWRESDAEDLYKYASDPAVGPIAGWPVHRSIEESREIIRTVFCGEEAYAICLKKDNRAVGAIELKLKGRSDLIENENECEMGFWLGRPFWGQGYMPEAVHEMLRHAFQDLSMNKVWCGYYDGNVKSKRVQEKTGFRYRKTIHDKDVPLLQEKRTEQINCIKREEYLADK